MSPMIKSTPTIVMIIWFESTHTRTIINPVRNENANTKTQQAQNRKNKCNQHSRTTHYTPTETRASKDIYIHAHANSLGPNTTCLYHRWRYLDALEPYAARGSHVAQHSVTGLWIRGVTVRVKVMERVRVRVRIRSE